MMPFVAKGTAKEGRKVPRDVAPNAWGQLRSELAQGGYTNQWITEQLGGSLGGRKTMEIVELLREAMNTEEAARVRRGRQ